MVQAWSAFREKYWLVLLPIRRLLALPESFWKSTAAQARLPRAAALLMALRVPATGLSPLTSMGRAPRGEGRGRRLRFPSGRCRGRSWGGLPGRRASVGCSGVERDGGE